MGIFSWQPCREPVYGGQHHVKHAHTWFGFAETTSTGQIFDETCRDLRPFRTPPTLWRSSGTGSRPRPPNGSLMGR
ncbi:hypothetical protein WN55_05788 [Dufourea novaeangliae]|uniref:Uncharacterized protein n=1 Tax=Dufourea novaeangliae TaxID=178035 RepID=A0A154P2B5_DUFNO|nr:hypothetical protein WN55_05788 [Dufourea novaeangliae]